MNEVGGFVIVAGLQMLTVASLLSKYAVQEPVTRTLYVVSVDGRPEAVHVVDLAGHAKSS